VTLSNRNLALIGAGLLVVGLFTPIVTMPFVGTINMLANGNGGGGAGALLLMLAALAAGLIARGGVSDAFWPGAAASGLVAYQFVRLHFVIGQMRESAMRELAGNPFAGLAQGALSAVQVQWGWLVLAAGAGLLAFAGWRARQEEGRGLRDYGDVAGKAVAGLSAACLVLFPMLDLAGLLGSTSVGPRARDAAETVDAPTSAAAPTIADPAGAEEARYIKEHVVIYDLSARYMNSLLDGRIPGVEFKIRNTGNRTLNRVEVRVVFYDANDKPIAEEEYSPVLVSEYSYSGNNAPLRPNYIWQNESDQFFAAKSVPSEWKAGRVTATVTEIEFGPNEPAPAAPSASAAVAPAE